MLLQGICKISTHAPRTGSDVFPDARTLGRRDFNPRSPHGERHTARPKNGGLKDISTHAPRTGSDKQVWLANRMAFEFQPTLPARGATPSATRAFGTSRFQPTLPARGATRKPPAAHQPPEISTHAPRTGSDEKPPAAHQPPEISTHAPRTGSDGEATSGAPAAGDFNPRSPHGERRLELRLIVRIIEISTHAPRTGSDGQEVLLLCLRQEISTHAPRTGSDSAK